MRFALLGNHPDGLAMARALVATHRHELTAYSGPPSGVEALRLLGLNVRPIGDIEEILADPQIEMVIVAGSPATRPEQLRRALQSERHVLCVHPPDASADIAYEAAMIQADTGHLLLPLLPQVYHPAIERLLALIARGDLGDLQLVEMEYRSSGGIALEPTETKPNLPGWELLRRIGGEIAEVSAFAAEEEMTSDQPLLLAGRFERGGLFRSLFLPGQGGDSLRVVLIGSRGRAELVFPEGMQGAGRLMCADEHGATSEERWEAWDPWPAMVAVFEAAIESKAGNGGRWPNWQTAIRCLELDDAARRSVERRRSSAMEYQEASEEVGFKGTMTLVGCGLLWAMLGLLILSAWFPKLGWLIIPTLAVFLILQLLRWVIPSKERQAPS